MGSESLSHRGILEDLGKYFSQFGEVANASLRPITPDSGTSSPLRGLTTGPTGLLQDIGTLDSKDVGTILELLKNAASGELVDDKRYIMERVIQVCLKANNLIQE